MAFTFKILIMIILKNCILFLSDLTDLSDLLIVKNISGPWKLVGKLDNTLNLIKLKMINRKSEISSNIFVWNIFFFTFETVQSSKKFHHIKFEKSLPLISMEAWLIFVVSLLINWLVNV